MVDASVFAGPPAVASSEVHRLTFLVDTPTAQAFDDITNLASQVCGAPVSLVGLLEERCLWLRSRTGLDRLDLPEPFAFCADSGGEPDLLIVPDMAADNRFGVHPLVVGHPYIRFYAGVTLRTPEGQVIGALGVLDEAPRQLGADQVRSLRALARRLSEQIFLRQVVRERQRALSALEQSEHRWRTFMEHAPLSAFVKDEDGRLLYLKGRAPHGRPGAPEELVGRTDAQLWPEALREIDREHDRQVLAENRPLTMEEQTPEPGGGNSYWLTCKFPLGPDPAGQRLIGGLSLDITDRKESELERERLIQQLTEALAQVKTLRGFLPICAGCKQIRNDAGYWQQIETYLREHTEAEFTHGMCPPCLQECYRGFRPGAPAPPAPDAGGAPDDGGRGGGEPGRRP